MLVLAGVLLTGVACDGEPGPATSAPATTPPPAGPPPRAPLVEPIKLSDRPLWTSPIGEDEYLPRFTVMGDAVVHATPHGVGPAGSVLVVHDAATGAVRWSVRKSDRIGPNRVTLDPDNVQHVRGLLIAAYQQKDVRLPNGRPGREEGLVALSMRDGGVRWQLPLLQDRIDDPMKTEPEPYKTVSLAETSNDEMILATIRTRHHDRPTEQSALAISPVDRRTLWTAPGFEAVQIIGGVVLGEVPSKRPLVNKQDTTPVTAAVDARTGARRWDLLNRDHTVLGPRTDNGVLVTAQPGTSSPTKILVDPETGRETALSSLFGTTCHAEGRLIACATDTDLHTYDTATGVTERAPLPVPGAHVSRVWRQRVILRDNVVVDRAGTRIGGPLPGRPREFRDGYALFEISLPDKQKGFAVYRLSE
ncbi:putative pyrroloquinoline-quinone binding quinoprotein [Herbihabitans rhizosphaerae]|uniref:Putative pyrroloquinoline-quinone binding quinoprotein n=1 Tax=Herbihabitans rhizosphaerae TaxID=1872711 RepID=A0A4Q7KMR4_9PSEU|nr:putative pyrroloquinoline-quinone binding quinoprotein [Herbihabitans rhizosphaerae]